MTRRIAILVALASCTALLGGCIAIPMGVQTGGGTSAATTPAGGPSNAAHPSADTAAVGQTLTAGALKVTVQSAKTARTLPTGQKAPSGKEFLLVEIDFQNQTTEAVVIVPADFKLASQSGKSVAPASPVPSAFNAQQMRPLNPAFGTSTVFVYQVPAGSLGYTFSYTPQIVGKKPTLRWTVP